MKKRTKNLIKIGVLASALALIGGTFAFTSFGQRVLNITEGTNRPEHGGRVHDYFDDESGNKDVFAENFGTDEILTRVKFTELFTKNGVSIVDDADIDINDPETWPTWIPGPAGSPTGSAAETCIGANEPINTYFHLALGQATHGDDRPWFMPTFNLDPVSMMTAAAGTAFDMEHEGVTHPGEGTDGYWGSGDLSFALPVTGDSPEEHATRQVLDQDRAPVTYLQWLALNADDRVGNFWVIDQETGWAYWADFLAGGAATSFLLDSKLPQTTALEGFEGDWSYQLHVIGQFASEGGVADFWEDDNEGDLDTTNGEAIIDAILAVHTPAP